MVSAKSDVPWIRIQLNVLKNSHTPHIDFIKWFNGLTDLERTQVFTYAQYEQPAAFLEYYKSSSENVKFAICVALHMKLINQLIQAS
jgi:hypothetical protein